MKKNAPDKVLAQRWVISIELGAFSLLALFLWLDEYIDIPHRLWGAPKSQINWQEALFEIIIVIIVGVIVIYFTHKTFRRMKYLEGILPICASCKKIRDEKGNWHQIESYIDNRTGAAFSHGLCPECAQKLYPELDLSDK